MISVMITDQGRQESSIDPLLGGVEATSILPLNSSHFRGSCRGWPEFNLRLEALARERIYLRYLLPVLCSFT